MNKGKMEQRREGRKEQCQSYHSEELLSVVLHERVEGLPAEGLGELLGADGPIARLQLMEHSLQGQRYTFGGVVTLRRHLVHSLLRDSDVGVVLVVLRDDSKGTTYYW